MPPLNQRIDTRASDLMGPDPRHIDECIHLLHEHEHGRTTLPAGEADINIVIKALMHMIGISAHSLVKLTDEVGLAAKDGYPLARSIIEGAVNSAYLMASEPDVARKARRHAEVRAFQDMTRNIELGPVAFRVGYESHLPAAEKQRLEEMASEFTTSKGRPKDWTDLKLNQRLDVVASVFPKTALISLGASYFNIYRHASEVVHGSYYGALMIWGTTAPNNLPITRDDFRLIFLDHQFSTLVSAIFAFSGLVECFSAYAKIPRFKTTANDSLEQLARLPAVAETLEQSR